MPRYKSTPLTLNELFALIPRLHATVDMLIAKSAAPATGGARGARRGRRGRRGGGEVQTKLLTILKGAKSGLSLGQLSEKTGGLDRGAIKYHLRALRSQKKARVVGDRKLARWHAVG
jgi:hypothetical protein